jgi:hypothetical protein
MFLLISAWDGKRKESSFLEKTPDYPDDKAQSNTEQNHGGDWKVKSEIFPLNPDVAGQSPEPLQPVSTQPDHQPGNDDHNADQHQYFSCFCHILINLLFLTFNSLK